MLCAMMGKTPDAVNRRQSSASATATRSARRFLAFKNTARANVGAVRYLSLCSFISTLCRVTYDADVDVEVAVAQDKGARLRRTAWHLMRGGA